MSGNLLYFCGHSHLNLLSLIRLIRTVNASMYFCFIIHLACSRLWAVGDKQKKRASERKKRGRTKARNGERSLPSLPRRRPPLLFFSLAFFRPSTTTESLEDPWNRLPFIRLKEFEVWLIIWFTLLH